jgi:hypothetical protein
MIPLAVMALVSAILGVTVSWPWFIGIFVSAPYWYAWAKRESARRAVDEILSA